METNLSDTASKSFSRRSLLKGSMKLGAAAVAAPALALGAIESAAPAVEKAAVTAVQWFEEVGGI
ncbi:MAG TPA: hypothetical protein VG714_10930 [Acidobacteriaceae bacterium]|nr:hypothetical protein [Acidobacteriaceae bacterium]